MVFLQLAILSHCLADFIFQSNEIVQLRKSSNLKKCLKGNILHAMIVFIILFVFLIIAYKFKIALLYSLIIGIFHFIIDITKNLLSLKIKSNHNRLIYCEKKSFLYIILTPLYHWINSLIFVTDQILHIAIIFFINSSPDSRRSIQIPFLYAKSFLKIVKSHICLDIPWGFFL